MEVISKAYKINQELKIVKEMKTRTVKVGKIVSRPSLNDTLRNLPLGKPQKFSVRQFKISGMRTAASTMKKQGYEFSVSEKGLVDEYIVTRLK